MNNFRIGLFAAAAAGLAACGPSPIDPNSQVGPNPILPAIHQYLLPPMKLAKVIGWQAGQAPTPAPGLKIQALATGLKNPRSLYTLPNGDILVVETAGGPAVSTTRMSPLGRV